MFPGATATRDDADYVLFGAPLDATTTFQPGARFGPERIRRFARTFDDYDRRTDRAFTDLNVHDAGDLRAWPDVPDYLDFLAGDLTETVRDGAVPLLLGGEHTVTAAGVAATDPDVVVCLDAHLDLRETYDGDPWSHACVMRRALDGPLPDVPAGARRNDGEGEGDGATDEEGEGDGATDDARTVDELVVVGARTGSEAEWDRADDPDVTVVPPEDAADWTPGFDADDAVYLSVDVDGADPAFAPGTGTMEPFGLTPREMRSVVRTVAPGAVACDVVEVNDRDDGQAAALGGKLLREFVYAHADGRR